MGILNFFKKDSFNMDTLEGIEKIKISKYPPIKGLESPIKNIEYILQRKATEHKKNGRMDLAIACLKKSNELMPHSNFQYQASDYMRYIKYLRQNGQEDIADSEENRLHQEHPELFDKRIGNRKRIIESIEKCKQYNTDLIYIKTNGKCPLCKKYNNKIFSISGKSKKYPQLPKEFLTEGGFDKDCFVGVSIKL